ncbi:MAG: Gmad2 immunoglobulin-like domain-containing protein [Marmoricola sp.]
MTPRDRPDDDLRVLLQDAVSEVHPEPALGRIRQRTRPAVGIRRLPPWLAVTAAAATVAAIVGGIALVNRPQSPVTGGPAGRPSGSATGAVRVVKALGIYYVGDTPQGPRLYREFHRARLLPGRSIAGATDLALGRPTDFDYRSPWPSGTTVDEGSDGTRGPATISLRNSSVDLGKRPSGMSRAEANEAVQQLVYTAQAALQVRRPVRFQIDGKVSATLLGVDVSQPVSELAQLDVLALVSITDPTEGAGVKGSFTARGVASSFEANVPWQITKNGKVVKSGFSTAAGWVDKLYPWATDPIDVSNLAPGAYAFVARTDDPSAGEGAGPMTDTRTIVVRR